MNDLTRNYQGTTKYGIKTHQTCLGKYTHQTGEYFKELLNRPLPLDTAIIPEAQPMQDVNPEKPNEELEEIAIAK